MGAREWNKIAEHFNAEMGVTYNRTGKQCRQRWMNILDPSIKKDRWSIKEDLILLQRQQELGNKWIEISLYLNGRTESMIKNRFQSLLKK